MKTENLRSTFASNVERLRKSKNLTYAALAEKVGVTPAFAYQLSVAQRGVSLDTIAKVAAVFGVTGADMLTNPKRKKEKQP